MLSASRSEKHSAQHLVRMSGCPTVLELEVTLLSASPTASPTASIRSGYRCTQRRTGTSTYYARSHRFRGSSSRFWCARLRGSGSSRYTCWRRRRFRECCLRPCSASLRDRRLRHNIVFLPIRPRMNSLKRMAPALAHSNHRINRRDPTVTTDRSAGHRLIRIIANMLIHSSRPQCYRSFAIALWALAAVPLI